MHTVEGILYQHTLISALILRNLNIVRHACALDYLHNVQTKIPNVLYYAQQYLLIDPEFLPVSVPGRAQRAR